MYNGQQFIQPYSMYNQQTTIDNLDEQINKLQKLKSQIQQPTQQPSINQTFQLAPTNNTMKYANSIDEVQRETIIGDTPFFSKDMSIVWIKNTKGDIKTYELNEIVAKDEKDMQIEYLQAQINELRKGMNKYDASFRNVDEKQNATNSTTNDESMGTTIEKNEPTSIQKISRSKTK